ncbi:MAG TPA: PilN domain-containing protein, partial [Smithellaceae bacterium]|nr:PilN domain-containing protein [Smithellaceae bacterium]
MIKINLIPYHEKEKKEDLARQIAVMAGAFLLFILCLVGVYAYMTVSIGGLETRLTESREKLKALDAKVGDLGKFKSQIAEFELKLGVIKTLEENRVYPVKLFDDLAMQVPPKSVWLTKIGQSQESLTIEGIGRDNIAVAGFMKTIENFPA